MTLVFSRGDAGFDLNFSIVDSDGDIVNIATVSSIIFKMRLLNATTAQVSSACTTVTATSGICKYTVLANDFNTLGNYESELQINYPANKIVTAKLDDIFIASDV